MPYNVLDDIYDFSTIPTTAGFKWLVDKLLMPEGVNLLVGESGLGKTPLALTLGVAVAAGVPFLGRDTKQGVVLYCDAESDSDQFRTQLGTISTALGLTTPPSDFKVWSPYWAKTPSGLNPQETIFEAVRALKPSLVVIDTLRAFWSDADAKSETATTVIKTMRTAGGTWLLVHHPRKPSREFAPPSLKDDPQGWMMEAAGSHALVNHTDTRLGVEKGEENVELTLGGFRRSVGPIVPIQLSRIYDTSSGEPLAYELSTGVDFLSDKHRTVFDALPSLFHFKDVLTLMGGKSASMAARFIQRCKDVKVIEPIGKAYAKIATVTAPGGGSTPGGL